MKRKTGDIMFRKLELKGIDPDCGPSDNTVYVDYSNGDIKAELHDGTVVQLSKYSEYKSEDDIPESWRKGRGEFLYLCLMAAHQDEKFAQATDEAWKREIKNDEEDEVNADSDSGTVVSVFVKPTAESKASLSLEEALNSASEYVWNKMDTTNIPYASAGWKLDVNGTGTSLACIIVGVERHADVKRVIIRWRAINMADGLKTFEYAGDDFPIDDVWEVEESAIKEMEKVASDALRQVIERHDQSLKKSNDESYEESPTDGIGNNDSDVGNDEDDRKPHEPDDNSE